MRLAGPSCASGAVVVSQLFLEIGQNGKILTVGVMLLVSDKNVGTFSNTKVIELNLPMHALTA